MSRGFLRKEEKLALQKVFDNEIRVKEGWVEGKPFGMRGGWAIVCSIEEGQQFAQKFMDERSVIQ